METYFFFLANLCSWTLVKGLRATIKSWDVSVQRNKCFVSLNVHISVIYMRFKTCSLIDLSDLSASQEATARTVTLHLGNHQVWCHMSSLSMFLVAFCCNCTMFPFHINKNGMHCLFVLPSIYLWLLRIYLDASRFPWCDFSLDEWMHTESVFYLKAGNLDCAPTLQTHPLCVITLEQGSPSSDR